MDPNETLRRLREICGETLWKDKELTGDSATEMAELVDALDMWLSAGNFLPEAWKR